MNEVITLGQLSIGDRFITATDFKKRSPTWEVLGKPEFNFRHGSATRECKNEVTGERVSKSGRLKVVKLTSKKITMSNRITIKEALEQGYIYFAYGNNDEYQCLYSIQGITDADFETGPLFISEKESYYTPSISSEKIAETVADIVSCQNNDETGDDTDDVYDIVKSLDFSEAAAKINEALISKKYYKLTKIQLIPNDQ